jgi:hypothetical protein
MKRFYICTLLLVFAATSWGITMVQDDQLHKEFQQLVTGGTFTGTLTINQDNQTNGAMKTQITVIQCGWTARPNTSGDLTASGLADNTTILTAPDNISSIAVMGTCFSTGTAPVIKVLGYASMDNMSILLSKFTLTVDNTTTTGGRYQTEAETVFLHGCNRFKILTESVSADNVTPYWKPE